MTDRFRLVLVLSPAFTVPALAGPQGASSIQTGSVQWTPVNAPKVGYRLQMPCAEDQIAAFQQENEFRRKVGAVGCETSHYKAIAFVMTGMPPSFFADLVSKSKKDRIPPFKIATRENLRIRGAPQQPGDKQLLFQVTDLGNSRYLMISFEQEPLGTPAVAEKLFNSLEVQALWPDIPPRGAKGLSGRPIKPFCRDWRRAGRLGGIRGTFGPRVAGRRLRTGHRSERGSGEHLRTRVRPLPGLKGDSG